MMITKNLSNTEKREEEKKKWRKKRIYILKILIAMFNKCDVEHMLFFILSNVCHRLSSACSTLAIVSSLDGALSVTPELSVAPSPNDEQDIRHTKIQMSILSISCIFSKLIIACILSFLRLLLRWINSYFVEKKSFDDVEITS